MHDLFERALIENPGDLASYSAYADWLQEQGDPHGEFIAVQLALEDETRPKTARDALKTREAELLAEHEREWMGELAQFLEPPPDPDFDDPEETRNNAYRWRRGFLAEIEAGNLTMEFARALAGAPAARLLRVLRIHEMGYYHTHHPDERQKPAGPIPPGINTYHSLLELRGAACLRSLRVFYIGDRDAEPPDDAWCDCHTYAEGLDLLVAGMSRIEELHLLCKEYESANLFALPNLTNLRVLRMYHLGGRGGNRRYEYALDVLARNPAFANLTQLLFHPHQAEDGYGGDDRSYLPLAQVEALVRSPHLKNLTHLQLRLSDMGDDGVRAIIASGILKRLRRLDLRHGCITDDGAQLFAACPEAKTLEQLDVSRNAVSATGLAALRAAGVNAVANRPLTPDELNSREYLRDGDFE